MPTDRPTLAGRDCRAWIGAAVHVFQRDLFTAAIFVQTQRAVLKSAARCESSHEVMKSPVSGHDRARVRIDWCVLLALLIAASGHAEQAWRVLLGAAHHGRAGLPTAGAGSCSQPFGKPDQCDQRCVGGRVDDPPPGVAAAAAAAATTQCHIVPIRLRRCLLPPGRPHHGHRACLLPRHGTVGCLGWKVRMGGEGRGVWWSDRRSTAAVLAWLVDT